MTHTTGWDERNCSSRGVHLHDIFFRASGIIYSSRNFLSSCFWLCALQRRWNTACPSVREQKTLSRNDSESWEIVYESQPVSQCEDYLIAAILNSC